MPALDVASFQIDDDDDVANGTASTLCVCALPVVEWGPVWGLKPRAGAATACTFSAARIACGPGSAHHPETLRSPAASDSGAAGPEAPGAPAGTSLHSDSSADNCSPDSGPAGQRLDIFSLLDIPLVILLSRYPMTCDDVRSSKCWCFVRSNACRLLARCGKQHGQYEIVPSFRSPRGAVVIRSVYFV